MRVPTLRLRQDTPFYLAVAFLASSPAWIVKHPPLQDLPLHLATIRTVRSFHDPAFGFDQTFVLAFGRTQYLTYYVLGAALAFVVGPVVANVFLVSLYLAGTVLALRSLLRALGRDERLCLFVMPLLVNTMFIYGLLPFLIGIPLMLWALATAIVHFRDPRFASGTLFCILSLALFYSHILPFGLFCIGAAALFPWSRRELWWRSAAPALPVASMLAWWTLGTEAGRLSFGAAASNSGDPHKAMDAAIVDLPNWLVTVLRDRTDVFGFVAFAMVVVAAFRFSLSDHLPPLPRAYVAVPLSCVVLYFVLPEGHGYIWLISQRFPILFAITAIPLVRMPTGQRGAFVNACALVVGLGAIANTCWHFLRFEHEEVGDFDAALDSMASGRKVCALIFAPASAIMNNQPFLHFGSYYQAAKGGVVMFTFAGYAHWPVDFLPGKYPPPGGPARLRWEWTPARVPFDEIYSYYDYVLTRGLGFRPPEGTYHVTWKRDPWTVWERGEPTQ